MTAHLPAGPAFPHSRPPIENEGLQTLVPPGAAMRAPGEAAADAGRPTGAAIPIPPATAVSRPVLGPVLRPAFGGHARGNSRIGDAPADAAAPAADPPAVADDEGAGQADVPAADGILVEAGHPGVAAEPCPLPGNVTDLERAFWSFHNENPAIYELFTTFMRDVIERGLERISADQVMHRIRWECDVVTRGGGRFKVNNNFVAYYARLWLHHHPFHRDMFRTRRVRTGERVQPRREGHRMLENAG